jgi:hypothetical protein
MRKKPPPARGQAGCGYNSERVFQRREDSLGNILGLIGNAIARKSTCRRHTTRSVGVDAQENHPGFDPMLDGRFLDAGNERNLPNVPIGQCQDHLALFRALGDLADGCEAGRREVRTARSVIAAETSPCAPPG